MTANYNPKHNGPDLGDLFRQLPLDSIVEEASSLFRSFMGGSSNAPEAATTPEAAAETGYTSSVKREGSDLAIELVAADGTFDGLSLKIKKGELQASFKDAQGVAYSFAWGVREGLKQEDVDSSRIRNKLRIRVFEAFAPQEEPITVEVAEA